MHEAFGVKGPGGLLLGAKKELTDAIIARFRERGKKSRTHEVKRLIAKTWKDLANATDLTLPNKEVVKAEPSRDSRRLQMLRGWSHENNNEIFPRST